MPEPQKTLTIDISQRPELPADYQTFKQAAQSLAVVDDDSCRTATRMIERQSAWDAGVEKFFAKASKAAYDAWQSIVAKGNDKKEPGLIAQLQAPMAVRVILEPRIKSYLRAKEEKRRAEELRLQREAEKREHEARQEALRIQQEAERAAEELRRAGQMREAKETQTRAQEQAAEVVNTAQALADIGTVLPATKVEGAPGESRPWQAEVTDLKAMCLAIGKGEIPLTYEMPKRGGGSEMVALVEPNMALLNYLAKRHGREDMGVMGARGIRGLQLKFSAKDISTAAEHSKVDDTGGW